MNRHLRKIFFYCLGRFFYLVGLYDKATFYYSKAIRFRFFFIDIQDRYKKSITRGSANKSFLLKGGIGDILQHLPFMLENKSLRYIVVTHFSEAKYFLENLEQILYEVCPEQAILVINHNDAHPLNILHDTENKKIVLLKTFAIH